jgi:hypothetical protein
VTGKKISTGSRMLPVKIDVLNTLFANISNGETNEGVVSDPPKPPLGKGSLEFKPACADVSEHVLLFQDSAAGCVFCIVMQHEFRPLISCGQQACGWTDQPTFASITKINKMAFIT